MQIFNPQDNFRLQGIVAAFSSRQDGNMSLCFGDISDSLANRKKFLSGIGIDYKNLVCAKQVHGKKIEYVTQANQGSGAEDYDSSIADTDGFLTDQSNVPIAVLTADCLSIFIYDPRRPAIAILHAGWRSTEKNISQEAIQIMQDRFSSKPEELLISFGPVIGASCFEVEKDFKTDFPFGLINREGRIFMDIALINYKQLLDCGVRGEHISDPKLCTVSKNKDFFSFRKEAQAAGRMISVLMLK